MKKTLVIMCIVLMAMSALFAQGAQEAAASNEPSGEGGLLQVPG